MRKKGFSLMEVIIAVAVITTGLIVSIALISFSVSGIRINKSKLVAAGLAQEGIEVIRNIRDSNWLFYRDNPENWTLGLEPGDYEVQYNDDSLRTYSGSGNYLKINTDGFYQYVNGSNTSFKRKITIEQITEDEIKVVSKVTWTEKGKSNLISVENHLYNWFK